MSRTQVFRVTGLVQPHFVDRWTRQVGTAMGRFDSKRGVFQARNDNAESAFTERALAEIDKQIYATLIPPLEARTFIPTAVKAHPGAETYIWRKVTRKGIARLVTGTSMDLPRASMFTDEIQQKFYTLGVKIVYNYFELLAIGMALANGQGVDLIGESMRAAMEAIEKKLDYVAAFGTALVSNFTSEVEADVGLTGLLNNVNATAYTIPPGASGLTAWSGKMPDEVLADLNGIVGGQIASTYKVHSPDTVIVPISQMETQLTRRMSDISNTTILEVFLNPRKAMGQPVNVGSWMYATGSGPGSSDLIVAYKRDPRMLEHILSMDASPLPATTAGLETTQPVVARTAGLVTRYPLSQSVGSGI